MDNFFKDGFEKTAKSKVMAGAVRQAKDAGETLKRGFDWAIGNPAKKHPKKLIAGAGALGYMIGADGDKEKDE